MVTKHKKPKIRDCGFYENGFEVQWDVIEKGDCFLSVLFPETISRALREEGKKT